MTEILCYVETLLGVHGDTLAGVVKTGARQKLSDVIAALDLHTSDQTGGPLAGEGARRRRSNPFVLRYFATASR
jgi:hypothetical protein